MGALYHRVKWKHIHQKYWVKGALCSQQEWADWTNLNERTIALKGNQPVLDILDRENPVP